MEKKYTIGSTWNGEQMAPHQRIYVEMEMTDGGDLNIQIDAPFYGDPVPDQSSGSTWKLWNHEVVEVFLVGPDGHYLESEFGPHGHYLLLQLDAPRSIVTQEMSVDYVAQIQGQRWQGRARIAANLLPSPISRINLFAIHGVAAERRFLAWSPLPGTQPDFHQPAQFPHF